MTLRFLTAGESHGPALTAILEGLPAGLLIDEKALQLDMRRRQTGYGAGQRMKIESDNAQILSGVMSGKTTGGPVCLLIQNKDHMKWKGEAIDAFTTPRPGHADLTGAIKFVLDDLRPALERASARETAARVAVGALCKMLLAEFGIQIEGYVSSIAEISADLEAIPVVDRFDLAEKSEVRCPDAAATEKMRERIHQAIEAKDTLGGIIEVVAVGVPAGLGSFMEWDRRLDARLGSALLSIPGIKGVEIGQAFTNASLPGTKVHDAIYLDEGNIRRSTNRAGGLEGGITNGEPVFLRAAMKPVASTLHPQLTVNLATGEETVTVYERSDTCPVPRAVPVVESMVAFILADALMEKLGGDSLSEMKPRMHSLRKAALSDLKMKGASSIYWPGNDQIIQNNTETSGE